MVVMTPRESWTDPRLDEFAKRIDERFDDIDRRLDSQQKYMDARFDAQQKHMDGRFDGVMLMLQIGFGLCAVILAALIGLIATQL